jgi:hypothetical protein
MSKEILDVWVTTEIGEAIDLKTPKIESAVKLELSTDPDSTTMLNKSIGVVVETLADVDTQGRCSDNIGAEVTLPLLATTLT